MSLLSVDLHDLYLFFHVVEHRGFTAAGEKLGIPKSRISRRITQLENTLGVRLLQRTSRRVNLTDVGQDLYNHCQAMIAEAQAGEAAVHHYLAEPSGQIRVSAPIALTDIVLAHLLPRFMVQYPKIRLVIQATNRQVDLLEENFDIVIRGVGVPLDSSSLVQVNLCSVSWQLLASPAYLAKTGAIDNLDQLFSADILLHSSINETKPFLHLLGPTEEINKPVQVRLQSDHFSVLKQAALAGMGIASLPLYACTDELKSHALQIVLPEWRPKSGQLIALFPTRKSLAPAVRAFIDFLKTELSPLFDCR